MVLGEFLHARFNASDLVGDQVLRQLNVLPFSLVQPFDGVGDVQIQHRGEGVGQRDG